MGVGMMDGGVWCGHCGGRWCGCGYSGGRYVWVWALWREVCGLFCTLKLHSKSKDLWYTCMSGVCVELDEEWYHKIGTIPTHKYMYPLHQIDNIIMVKVCRHTISHTRSLLCTCA